MNNSVALADWNFSKRLVGSRLATLVERMLAKLLFVAYAIDKDCIRRLILSLIKRLEKGESYSPTLRAIFVHYHNVHVGLYSMGGCFSIGHFDRHTTIGRFCSISRTAYAMNRNHPVERKSTHAFFYNPVFGFCHEDRVPYTALWIGNDVWIGHNVTIMPHVRSIGDGAVVGAGAVVNKEVPPYAIVLGNPARVVRYRFSAPTIERLLAERWWDKSIGEVLPHFAEYCRPYEERSTPATPGSASIAP